MVIDPALVCGAPVNFRLEHEPLWRDAPGGEIHPQGDYLGGFRLVSREPPNYHFAKLPQTPVTAFGNT